MSTKRSIPPANVHTTKSKKRRQQSNDSFCLAQGKAHDAILTSQCELVTAQKWTATSGSTTLTEVTTRVAILVPFRDSHPTQRRRAHLNEFVHYMTDYLYRHCAARSASFHIFILEQSLDGRKFNRGKLLNAGFDMTRNEFDIFVFHDVDLLPGDDLSEFYTTVPHAGPMHIARVWERYNECPSYFGGIVAFTRQQFIKVNGFPNNFWGWGGEDNELYSRVVRKKLKVHAPTRRVISHVNSIGELDDR
ncbi:hypothetical protein PsorP6_000223 [Peronosclerospora sorghi]|uniref:Uncharacterized protein n=1 Tax=Peronosclerospora sorghi TaxID=230839 RepID=A0ACC0WWJ3_9STRA|nr:hypothetical protein PsorP6_000223 [Peronosclerospora sorghi]